MGDLAVFPSPWEIGEEGWNPERQSYFASILALGNGHLGSRSVLEEVPAKAVPGTYLAGVFDHVGGVVDDMVNLPNPFELRIFVGGQKLSVDTMAVLHHGRRLDMRTGILVRRTVFRGGLGGRFELRTERFIAREDGGTAVLKARFVSLDRPVEVVVAGDLGTGVVNHEPWYEYTKRHYSISRVESAGGNAYLEARMLSGEVVAGCAWTTRVGGKCAPVGSTKVRLGKGVPLSVERVARLSWSDPSGTGRLRRDCLRGLARTLRAGIPASERAHRRAWGRLWDTSDIRVAGDRDVQAGARFSVYHLLSAGKESGAPAGIGAKGLTGESYRGHYFWDTEMYMQPFYSFNHPRMAERILEYRISRLDAARSNARRNGYRGAQFPWESARTGSEVTPYFPDGKGGLYLWETGFFEHHIVADIALALARHVEATGDAGLMARGGFRLMAETARFWASRVKWNRRTGRYDINGVIGPDEYHYPVDNSVFTNCLARWNLEEAARLSRNPADARRMGVGGGETDGWLRIAGLLAGTEPSSTGGIIEQFRGYYRLREVAITRWTRNGLPEWPRGVDERNVLKTKLNKQADVVLLMALFPGLFTPEQAVANFRYYEKRTLHMSSLSACAFFLAGLEAGAGGNAMRYFRSSLFTDLKDGQRNTGLGMHIACCGGNWQMLVQGFGGAQVRGGTLHIAPRVPRGWGALSYSLRWKGSLLRVRAVAGSVRVVNEGDSPVEVFMSGRTVVLEPGKPAVSVAGR